MKNVVVNLRNKYSLLWKETVESSNTLDINLNLDVCITLQVSLWGKIAHSKCNRDKYPFATENTFFITSDLFSMAFKKKISRKSYTICINYDDQNIISK